MDITKKITELIDSVNNGEIDTLAELQRELIYFRDEIQALRQPLVSGRSEQFVCEHLHRTEYAHLGKYKCEDCGKWMDKQINCH